MKFPAILAALVASFIVLCLAQAWFWPIKALPDWQPAWWQNHFLSDVGFVFAVPSIHALDWLYEIGIESSAIQIILFFFVALVEVLIIFFVVKFALELILKLVTNKGRTRPVDPTPES